jgi:hypothetical protein
MMCNPGHNTIDWSNSTRTPAIVMMRGEQHLRDPTELEGTLLPVEAQAAVAVAVADAVDSPPSAATTTTTRAAKATTIAPFDRDLHHDRATITAIGIPDYRLEHGIGHQIEQEQHHAREGTYRGRVQAIEEIESIQRTNREAIAKAEMERQRVRSANEDAQAKAQQSALWLGAFETPPSAALDLQQRQRESADKPSTTTAAGARTTSKKGPGYQVSEYTVSQYDTVPYETTEYKSVYDP